jgi:hypothetical protein
MKHMAFALRLSYATGWLLMVAASIIFTEDSHIDVSGVVVFSGLAGMGFIPHGFLLRHPTLFAPVFVVPLVPFGTLVYAITQMRFIGDEPVWYFAVVALLLFGLGVFLLLLPVSLSASVCGHLMARKQHAPST